MKSTEVFCSIRGPATKTWKNHLLWKFQYFQTIVNPPQSPHNKIKSVILVCPKKPKISMEAFNDIARFKVTFGYL